MDIHNQAASVSPRGVVSEGRIIDSFRPSNLAPASHPALTPANNGGSAGGRVSDLSGRDNQAAGKTPGAR